MVTLLLRGYSKIAKAYAYIVIVNLLLIEHKIACIIVILDIFVVDTIPLDNYSQLACKTRKYLNFFLKNGKTVILVNILKTF